MDGREGGRESVRGLKRTDLSNVSICTARGDRNMGVLDGMLDRKKFAAKYGITGFLIPPSYEQRNIMSK